MLVCVGFSLLEFFALSRLGLSPYRGARPEKTGSDPVFSARGRSGSQGEQ
jgi:hypothetical protein